MAFITQKVFLDTSFFISFIDRVNFNHPKASQILEDLTRRNFQVYTSSSVVTTVFNNLEKELGVTVADEFLQSILESNIQILYPDKTDFLAVFRLLKNSTSRVASLSEMINATLMNRSRIYSILTFDPWHNLQKTELSDLLK